MVDNPVADKLTVEAPEQPVAVPTEAKPALGVPTHAVTTVKVPELTLVQPDASTALTLTK